MADTAGNPEQEAYFASTRGQHAGPAQPQGAREAGLQAQRDYRAARAAEPPELKFMRETRNAVVFIAWVVGLAAVISLIVGIVVAVQISKVNSQLSNLGGGTTSSNCMSQGGSDPSC